MSFFTPFAFVKTTAAAPAPPSFDYFLDSYPSASTAFSIRKLRSTYSGDCLVVKRSNDNATQSIGFVDNMIDTGSILSFVGSNNGYVTKWFDQSGNNRTLETNNISGNETWIVNSGSIITEGGLPSISNPNQNSFSLKSGSTFITIDYQTAYVVGINKGLAPTTVVAYPIGSNSSTGFGWNIQAGLGVTTNSFFGFDGGTVLDFNYVGQNIFTVASLYQTGSTGYGWVENVQKVTGTLGLLQFSAAFARGGDGSFWHSGSISEIITYDDNKINDASGSYSNIMTYYGL